MAFTVELWRQHGQDFYAQVFAQEQNGCKWYNVSKETIYQVAIYNPELHPVVAGFTTSGSQCRSGECVREGGCKPCVKFKPDGSEQEWEDVPLDAAVQLAGHAIEFHLEFYRPECRAVRKLIIQNSGEEWPLYFNVV